VHSATIKNASKTEGSHLTYEYEAMPDIPTINPKDLTLAPVPLRQVRDQDVDEALKDLTLQSGEWTDVTDRPAKEGDYVVIDIDDIGEPGGNICTDTLFQMVKGQMGDWMIRILNGLTPGQHAEGMSEKDKHPDDCKECKDGTHSHDDSFKPTMCRITLHKIRHVTPHPVDDELAKKYGAPNAQELQTRVKQSLERKALEEQKDHERRNVELQLLQTYAFDIPSSLIINELKSAKQAIQHDLQQRGVPEAERPEQAKKIEDELAQRYLRDYILYFLTQKYAKEHRIKVEQDELMMEFMRQMWLEKMGANSVNLQANDEERKAQLQMQMLAMKALDSISQEANKA
jgi:trigger factor